MRLPDVKVLVGKDRIPFEFSPLTVSHEMPLLAEMIDLDGEDVCNIVFMPHITPESFGYLEEWTVNKKFQLPPNTGGADSSVFWSILSKAYVAAEAMRATGLKRYVIDTIYSSVRDSGYGPDSEAIRFVYQNTPVTSGMQRIMVAFFVWQAAEGWWMKEKENEDDWDLKDMPEEFRNEVAVATLERVHLMDDGNPFNESDEVTETGFGVDYFYDDNESANLDSQKWLRNDPADLRPEEEWDAARFEVDKATTADRDMINDGQEFDRDGNPVDDPMTISHPIELADHDTGSTSEEGLDKWEEAGLEIEATIRSNVWIHLCLSESPETDDAPTPRNHAARELSGS